MMKRHKESDLQITCVKWFRIQYPAFARLLEHPHNEGNAFNSRQQAIANAEGVTKGVADLILHIPAYITGPSLRHSDCYHSLALELKTKEGRQSDSQKQWQRLFEAAGGRYVIVRSYEEFVSEVTRYMQNVPSDVYDDIRDAYAAIKNEAEKKALVEFRKFLNRK